MGARRLQAQMFVMLLQQARGPSDALGACPTTLHRWRRQRLNVVEVLRRIGCAERLGIPDSGGRNCKQREKESCEPDMQAKQAIWQSRSHEGADECECYLGAGAVSTKGRVY